MSVVIRFFRLLFTDVSVLSDECLVSSLSSRVKLGDRVRLGGLFVGSI